MQIPDESNKRNASVQYVFANASIHYLHAPNRWISLFDGTGARVRACICVCVWYGAMAMMTMVMPMAIVTTEAAPSSSSSMGSVSWAHTNNIFQTNIFLDCLFVIWRKQILLRGRYTKQAQGGALSRQVPKKRAKKKTMNDKKRKKKKRWNGICRNTSTNSENLFIRLLMS